MKILRLRHRATDRKGVVLVIVMSFVALMVLSVVSLSTMIQRDVRLIQRIKEKEQACFVAEGGVHHALAKIKSEGFAARADFSDSLDTGSYSVTFSETGGRYLVTSVGTVSGVSETVTAEISDNTPTAVGYGLGMGNDLKILSLVPDASIVGDIHTNDDIFLRSDPTTSWLNITGRVASSDTIVEGSKWHTGVADSADDHVVINGVADDGAVVYEWAGAISFATFDYAVYKQVAIDSGDYYSGDQIFSGTLSPGNGIVYVDGTVDITGTCTINGGL
ncbi:MAG: hypothetical protein V3T31_02740, partial [candidate division Zixibacteria bacterium]